MNHKTNTVRPFASPILCFITCLLCSTAAAQSGGGYDLSWSSIDNGAVVATGGNYTLTGITGQPDAAPTAATGGSYTLTGGFLHAPVDPNTSVDNWSLY